MDFTFDITGNYDIPLLTLCNPNKNEIATISNFRNLHIKLRFNAVSELTFDIIAVPKKIEINRNNKLNKIATMRKPRRKVRNVNRIKSEINRFAKRIKSSRFSIT